MSNFAVTVVGNQLRINYADGDDKWFNISEVTFEKSTLPGIVNFSDDRGITVLNAALATAPAFVDVDSWLDAVAALMSSSATATLVDQGTSPWIVAGTVDVNQPVTVDQGTSPWVTQVSNFPATQPVSGTVSVDNFPATQAVSGTVAVSNFPATQPVSGTVTADQGTSPWVTTVNNFPATQTVSGTVAVSNFPATQAVSGTVAVSNFPATQPVSGTVTSNQGTSPWVTQVSNFPATQPVSGSVSVSNFPATQAVSGTVTANQGTSPWVTSTSTPATSDIVGAYRGATGTLYTVPAGRTFYGSLSLVCEITGVAGASSPTLTIAGAGAIPSGLVHACFVGGLTTNSMANSSTLNNVYIYGGSAGATITFTQGVNGTSAGMINGRLL